MLEQRLEAAEPTWQPTVASAIRWSELFNRQEVVAPLFLTPALVALACVLYPFFSAIRTSFHHKIVGAPIQSLRRLPGAVR